MDTVEKTELDHTLIRTKVYRHSYLPKETNCSSHAKGPINLFSIHKNRKKMKLLQEKTSSVNTSDIYSKATLVIG